MIRPAAAEVRQMLHKIKLDNIRSCGVAARAMPNYIMSAEFEERKSTWANASIASRSHLMGSFTSMPKVIPAADAYDIDVDYPTGSEDFKSFMDRCARQLSFLPPPLPRTWTNTTPTTDKTLSPMDESLRVFQWNVLSQTLGTTHDNFVKCPAAALDWRTRRYRMLEEIGRHQPDIICLQEVDHFRFLRKSLAGLGYAGHFFPKPDSPCLYLPDNAGPDGCAIFYKKDKFDLTDIKTRIIEVWHVQSNQVALLVTLRSKKTDRELCVASTHLKARSGALLTTLRNEQGKDLLEFLMENNKGDRPVICTGDFNAEPVEPVYKTMTSDPDLRLESAYHNIHQKEPDYTTWKIREDGEHVQTLDYMFHSSGALETTGVLNMPEGDDIGDARVPSLSYASDHFSLVADFIWKN